MGIAALFLGSFTIKARYFDNRQIPVLQDTIRLKPKVRINLMPVDSVEALGNLKFKPYKKKVHASYYADRFNGKRTASGARFSNKKFTAAHRKFPFGTKLRITNETTGQCVVVEVTDRGPFTKGREIDISRRAFMEIDGNQRTGGLTVSIDVIEY